jgi:hypothetical protein
MAATAGTLTLVGKSGRTYSIDVYIPDATGTLLTFNQAGLAASTSQPTFRLQEDASIVDFSIGTAPTAVGVVLQSDSAPIIGGALRWANQLQTLANRQKLAVGVRAGAFIGGVQF